MKEEVKVEVKPEVAPVLESVRINLAPNQSAINYCGRQYIHGATYQMETATASAVQEIATRGWAHEASLKESENKTRKQNRAYL